MKHDKVSPRAAGTVKDLCHTISREKPPEEVLSSRIVLPHPVITFSKTFVRIHRICSRCPTFGLGSNTESAYHSRVSNPMDKYFPDNLRCNHPASGMNLQSCASYLFIDLT